MKFGRLKMATIEAVIEEQAPSLMAIAGVTGVAQSEENGEQIIVVMVAHSDVEKEAPSTVGGYQVHFEVTGEFQAQVC